MNPFVNLLSLLSDHRNFQAKLMATKFEKYGGATFAVLFAAGALGAALFDEPVKTSQAVADHPDNLSDSKVTEVAIPRPSIDNAPGVAQAQHAVAGLINLNGHLCAKVENVQQLQMRDQVFEVTCTEYRGGSRRVRYLVNGSTGTASRL
jgi:hypothetical protein